MHAFVGYIVLVAGSCYSAWLVGLNCWALWGHGKPRAAWSSSHPVGPSQRR